MGGMGVRIILILCDEEGMGGGVYLRGKMKACGWASARPPRMDRNGEACKLRSLHLEPEPDERAPVHPGDETDRAPGGGKLWRSIRIGMIFSGTIPIGAGLSSGKLSRSPRPGSRLRDGERCRVIGACRGA